MQQTLVTPSRDGLIAGALGGGVALLTLLLARTGGGSPGILEIVSDAVARAFPPWLFDWGVKTLGPGAKGSLVVGVCLGLVAVGALLAWGLLRLKVVGRRGPLLDFALLALAAFALGELAVLPLAGVGLLGSGLVSDPVAVHLPLLAASLGYGVVASGWLAVRARHTSQRGESAMTPEAVASRRRFLSTVIALVGLGALSASGVLIVSRIVPRARPMLPGQVDEPGAEGFGFVRAVTPVPEFYFVSKDWLPMEIDPVTWRLNVDGLVDRPGVVDPR